MINYFKLYFICVTYGLPYFPFRFVSSRFFFSFLFLLFCFFSRYFVFVFCVSFFSFLFVTFLLVFFLFFSFRFFSFLFVFFRFSVYRYPLLTLRTMLVHTDVTSNWHILAATSYRITSVLRTGTLWLDLKKYLSFLLILWILKCNIHSISERNVLLNRIFHFSTMID